MFRKCQIIKLRGKLVKYSKALEMQILLSEARLRKWLYSDSTYTQVTMHLFHSLIIK
jgi:hypothetical protein